MSGIFYYGFLSVFWLYFVKFLFKWLIGLRCAKDKKKKKEAAGAWGIVSLSVPEFYLELRWWDGGESEGKTRKE